MNAHAQFEALERIIMPGLVISGHAEYEAECTSCHLRFSRGEQSDLCLDCHTEIADDLQSNTGFHSLSLDVGDNSCASCHTDHEGRDADIVGLDPDSFDHGLTDFELRDSHFEAVCEDCHTNGEQFHAAEPECVSCHRDDDQHLGNLGETCTDCHSETQWSDATYDHEFDSGFALLGAHGDLTCISCHVDEQYVDTPNQCVDCHQDDDTHMGTNGSECQDCHTPNDWTESLFDHFARTDFALTGGHSDVLCESCHEGNVFEQTTSSECVSCHLDDDAHSGVNGTECADCHRVTEWLATTFDHGRDSDFALNGAHADLACEDCHREPAELSLPSTECFGCHVEDEPHALQLGENCASCHYDTQLEWSQDVRFDHGLTQFPLLGRHVEALCEDCHETLAFHDAPELCVDCHREDDEHEATLGPQCAQCHTPFDWAAWRFDHDTQTDFGLEGAHAGLECSACHREASVDSVVALGSTCANCHRGDDVHRGEFGGDCGDCHSPDSFESLRVVQ